MNVIDLSKVPAIEPYKKEFLANNAAPEKYLTTTPLIFDFFKYLHDSGFALDPKKDKTELTHFVAIYQNSVKQYESYLNRPHKNTLDLRTWFMKKFYEPLFNLLLDSMEKQKGNSPIEDYVVIPRLLLLDSGTEITYEEETARKILLHYDRFVAPFILRFPKKYHHLAAYWNQIIGYYTARSEVPAELVNDPQNYKLLFTKLREIQTSGEKISVMSYTDCPRSIGEWDDDFLREEAKFWREMIFNEKNKHLASLPVDNPYLDEETFFKGLSIPTLPNNTVSPGFLTERKVEWIIEEMRKPTYVVESSGNKLAFLDNVKEYVTSVTSNTKIDLKVREKFARSLNFGDLMFAYFPEYEYCFSNKLLNISSGYYSDSQIMLFNSNQALKKFWDKDSSRMIASGILGNPNAEEELLIEVLTKYPQFVETLKEDSIHMKAHPPYLDLNNPVSIHKFLSRNHGGFIARYKKPSIVGMYLEALSSLPYYSNADREDYRERLNALMVGTEYEGEFLKDIPPTYVIIHLEMFLNLPTLVEVEEHAAY